MLARERRPRRVVSQGNLKSRRERAGGWGVRLLRSNIGRSGLPTAAQWLPKLRPVGATG